MSIQIWHLTIAGKVAGVLRRDPANVIGDGKSDITGLIAQKNIEKGKISANPPNKVDAVVHAHLRDTGLSLEHVPAAGKKIFLRANSNISTGGDAVNVMDSVHPLYIEKIEKAAAQLKPIFNIGFDLITTGISSPDAEWGVLEANYAAWFQIHHYPWSGEPVNVAKIMLEKLFPAD